MKAMFRDKHVSRGAAALLAASAVIFAPAASAAGATNWFSYTRVEADIGRGSSETSRSVEAEGWIGGDVNRLRWRASGESPRGLGEPTSVSLLYSRNVSDYWDFVAGIQADREEGNVSRTYAAIGFAGLAPYQFDVDATLAIGSHGARLDVEARHETLLTQNVVVYPFGALLAATRDDEEIGIGSGLNRAELGVGLRYEFTRRLGVYGTVSHTRLYGGLADAAARDGERTGVNTVRVGLRAVF